MYTLTEKIEIIKNTEMLWIDMWKNKLSDKSQSAYYQSVKLYKNSCGLCEVNRPNGVEYVNCTTCILGNIKKESCYYYYEWLDTGDAKYACRIAWNVRKYRRQLEKKLQDNCNCDSRMFEIAYNNLNQKIRSFIGDVNRVTVYHRHSQTIPKKELDNLSNAQLEIEKELRRE